MKAWRHDNLRGVKITIRARALQIDGDGFIKEALTPEEVTKLGNMPKWSFCDVNGPEIVATRRVDAEKMRSKLQDEIARQHQVLENLEQKLADISQRCVTLANEENAAAERLALESRQQPRLDVTALNWNQLRKVAADQNIAVSNTDERSEVEAAVLKSFDQADE